MKKFLLHTCCAPCSIAIIDELKDKYDLTVYFYNPNIFPEAEYLKRKAEVIKICKDWKVKMVDADYEPEHWNKQIKGLENEPEGGARCVVCFKTRLEKAASYAAQNGFDIFGTSLTSGRNKKADVIHPLGLALAEKYNLEFYRQDYCGCSFSKKIPPPASAS